MVRGAGCLPGSLFLWVCVDGQSEQRIFTLHLKINIMYSLKCEYYGAEFTCIGDLIAHIMISGMDPNYEITFNGQGTGEIAIDHITF